MSNKPKILSQEEMQEALLRRISKHPEMLEELAYRIENDDIVDENGQVVETRDPGQPPAP